MSRRSWTARASSQPSISSPRAAPPASRRCWTMPRSLVAPNGLPPCVRLQGAGWRPAASRQLAAHFADLDAAMPFVDRAERCSCFDGLQLLRVANQHDFRACICGMGQHALHLARADHACFVDDQHVARSQLFAALPPLMFKAGDGARRNARTMLQSFGSNAGKRRAANGIARAFPCLARHAQHRALAGPCIADDNGQVGCRHMLERRALLSGRATGRVPSRANASFPGPLTTR